MDLALGGELVQRAMARARDGDSLEAIIADTVLLGAAGAPSPVWDAVASVDTAPDVVALGRWITEKIAERPPPPHLSAIWFGLYELEAQGGATHAAIQLSGGTGFPKDPQWLFNQDWYTPGYAPTPGLASLLPLAAPAGPDLSWLVSYAVVFAYTLGLVATTWMELTRTLFSGNGQRLVSRWASMTGTSPWWACSARTGWIVRSSAGRAELYVPTPASAPAAGERTGAVIPTVPIARSERSAAR